MERTITPMTTHKRRRGFSVLETLVVLAIGAGIVGAAVATINEITIRNDSNKIFTAISDFERSVATHMRRRHSSSCAEYEDAVLGVEADDDLRSADGTDYDLDDDTAANEACRRTWRSMVTTVVRSNPEASDDATEEIATYDADGRQEFYVGSNDIGYDVGFALNMASADEGSEWQTITDLDTAADITDADVADCDDDDVKVALAVAVDSVSACELAVERLGSFRWRAHAVCVDPANGFDANEDEIQGDALLLGCYD